MAPMLSANLMRNAGDANHHKRNRVLERFESIGAVLATYYERLLRRSLARPWLTLVAATVFFFGSIFSMKYVGFTFLPEDEAGEIDIRLEAPPGTSFATMEEIVNQAEKTVAGEVPERTVLSTKVGNDIGETNQGSLYLKLVRYTQRKRTTSQVKSDLRMRLRPLIESHGLIAGIGNAGNAKAPKPISMIIQGNDNNTLKVLADQLISQATTRVQGVTNLESNLKAGRQELQLAVDRQNAAAFGLTVGEIGENVRALYEGLLAGVFRENGEEYDIRVRLSDEERGDSNPLKTFSLPNDRGDPVALGAVTHMQADTSPTSIVRMDLHRTVRIEGDLVPGVPLAQITQDLMDLAGPMMPPGYSFRLQGQAESLGDLKAGAVLALGLGAMFIYMVMAALYESFILPFAILMTLPLAIIGAILGLLVAGKFMDIYGVIGIILLMALVTKNGILLVDFAEQLRREGKSREEAILEAGVRRMRPIVMTTIAMIAGMLPVAIGYGEVNKVRAGMGVTTIGGLVSSTLLSLIVIPAVYIYLDRLRNYFGRIIDTHYFRRSPDRGESP
jgi:HAE1 family hydrophobic/amphiphilic exporter-1